MANKDELEVLGGIPSDRPEFNSDDFVDDEDETEVLGGILTEEPEAKTAEGVAREEIHIPYEPLDVLEKDNAIARSAYSESIYANRRKIYSEETEAQSMAAVDKIIGNRDIFVGPEAGIGGRILISGATIDSYKVHENIAIKNQGSGILNTFSRLPALVQAVDERTLTTEAAMIDSGNLNLDGTMKTNLPEGGNEKLQSVVLGTTITGAVVLGAFGLKGAGIPGGIMGSVAGLGLGALFGIGVGTFAELDGESSALEVTGDLVSKTFNVMGVTDDLHDILLNFTDEHRETTISAIVALGDALGLDEVPEFMERHGIVDTDDYVSKIQEAAKTLGALDEALEKSSKYERNLGMEIPMATSIIADVVEIAARIVGDDTYRELRAKEREASISKDRDYRSLESRNIKPTDDDWDFFRIYENIEAEDERKKTKDADLSNVLDFNSYASLSPALRKKQPSAAEFKKIVQDNISYDDPGMNLDDKHNLVAAIESVHLGKSNKEIQAILNRVTIQAFSLPMFDDMDKSFIPSIGEIDSWVEKVLPKQKKIGRKTTEVFERVAANVFTTPFESKEYGTLYKASAIGQILNWANLIPTLAAELDVGELLQFMGADDQEITLPFLFSGKKTLLEAVDLPFITPPAQADRKLGYRIRNPAADYLTRVIARMDSGTGGFQVGGAEVMRSQGFKQDEPEYNAIQLLGFLVDMLDGEKYIFSGVRRSQRLARNIKPAVDIYKGPAKKIAADLKAEKAAILDDVKSGVIDESVGAERIATRESVAEDNMTRMKESGIRYELTKQTLLSGVVDVLDKDPLITRNELAQREALRQLAAGIDPVAGLSEAQREVFRRVLILVGRDPDLYEAASASAAGNASKAKQYGERIVRQVGTSDVVVFRDSIEYRVLSNQVQKLVDEGIIPASGKDSFLAMMENQAFLVAGMPDTPFKTPIEVIRSIDLTIDKSPTGRVRFQAGDKFEADKSIPRIRVILEDIGVQEDAALFQGLTEFVNGGRSKYRAKIKNGDPIVTISKLEDVPDDMVDELFDTVAAGGIKPSEVKAAPFDPVEALRIYNRKENLSESVKGTGMPKPLTRGISAKVSKDAAKVRDDAKVGTVAAETNPKNAEAAYDTIDAAVKAMNGNSPLSSNDLWDRYMGIITGYRDIIEPPRQVMVYADVNKLADEVRKVSKEQVSMANAGIETVESIGALYVDGTATVELTGHLMLWTLLSKSASSFPHESGFIDSFLAGVSRFIKAASDGRYTARDLKAEKVQILKDVKSGNISKTVGDGLIAELATVSDAADVGVEFRAWASRDSHVRELMISDLESSGKITPARALELREGPAIPFDSLGSGVSNNLNDFGAKFLQSAAERLPEGHRYAGQTRLAAFHEVLKNQTLSGKEARRIFHTIFHKSGMENKVVSFLLLAAGRKDVTVIDRIQANHFWGRGFDGGVNIELLDGSLLDLYEGFKGKIKDPRPAIKKVSDALKAKKATIRAKIKSGKIEKSVGAELIAKETKAAEKQISDMYTPYKAWMKTRAPYSTSKGLASAFFGAKGLALYEAIEALLLKNVDEAYKIAGRSEEGSLGRFHWESWVLNSGQEVGHDSLKLILASARGEALPAVGQSVREGKFQLRRYGVRYFVLPGGKVRRYVMETGDGRKFILDKKAYNEFTKALAEDKKKESADRVVPRGWKVTDERYPDTPWFDRPGVNRDALDRLIKRVGREATAEEVVAFDRANRVGRSPERGVADKPVVADLAITGVQHERPAMAALAEQYKTLLDDLIAAKGSAKAAIQAQLDTVIDTIFLDFEASARSLFDVEGIKIHFIERSTGGFSGEGIEANLRIRVEGDEALIRDRAARFNRTSGQTPGPIDKPQEGGLMRVFEGEVEGAPNVLSPALLDDDLYKLIWMDGNVERLATMSIKLPDEMLTAESLRGLGPLFEKDQIGWSVDPKSGFLEMSHSLEWSELSAIDSAKAFIKVAGELNEIAVEDGFGNVAVYWGREKILVSKAKTPDKPGYTQDIRAYEQEVLSDAEIKQRGANPRTKNGRRSGASIRPGVSVGGPKDTKRPKSATGATPKDSGRDDGSYSYGSLLDESAGDAADATRGRSGELAEGVSDLGGVRLLRNDERGSYGLSDLNAGAREKTPVNPEVSAALFHEMGIDLLVGKDGKIVDNPDVLKIYPLGDKFGKTIDEVIKTLEDWSKTPDTVGDGWRFPIFGPTRGFNNILGRFIPPDFKNFSYDQKVAWIYQPYDVDGSFNDVAYTFAWRATHEVSHGIVNNKMTDLYGGVGARKGALGVRALDASGRVVEPLSLADVLRAVEWEHETFFKQREILEKDFKIKISDEEFNKEYALNMADAVHRSLTGKFSSPDNLGIVPTNIDPAQSLANAKSILRKAAREMNLDMAEDFLSPSTGPAIRAKVDSKNGSPLGYYQYDSNTGQSVINLFKNGDMSTLWHENGHMLAALMGVEWRQRLFGSFDHAVDADGIRVLSDLGHEQFADAWMYYRRIKDSPGGFVRRMFEDLWVQLHNLWNRIRKRPGLLPKEVRAFWDIEFGELPADRRFVTALTENITRRRPFTIIVDKTERGRILQSKPARLSREIVATEPSMNPEVLHQYLGDKLDIEMEVITGVDGIETRVPRRVYGETTDDALEVVRKVIAYIKTEEFRKNALKEPTEAVGMGRFIVPKSHVKTVLERSKKRLVDALGGMPDKLGDRIFQRRFKQGADGKTAITDRSSLPPYVSDSDFAEFANRILLRHGHSRRIAREQISTTEFIVFTDREAAGFKTLVQELAKEPIADLLPIDLLDPDSNFRLVAVEEYSDVVRVLQDVEAGPLARLHRNIPDPNWVNTFSIVLKSKHGMRWLGDKMSAVAEVFRKSPTKLNRANANPDLVEIFDGFQRRMANAAQEVIKDLKKFDDPDTDFMDFYEHSLKYAIPSVSLGSVKRLFHIVEQLRGLKGAMDADATLKMNKAMDDGTAPPTGLDPITREHGTLTLDMMFHQLPEIQSLLDGLRGMTRDERQALIKLRELKLKGALTEADRIDAGGAIQVLHIALEGKHAEVFDTALEVFKIALGVPNNEQKFGFSAFDPNIIAVYKAYYRGNFTTIADIGTTKGLYVRELDGVKKLFKSTQSERKDIVALLTNVLVYTKMADIRRGLARELAEAGYDSSRSKISGEIDLKGRNWVDRERFIDRVTFYINEELQFRNKLVLTKKGDPYQPVQVLESPKAPPETMYGKLEQPVSDAGVQRNISRLDKEAMMQAESILARAGIRKELGVFKDVRIGKKTFLLPENAILDMEEAFSEVFKSPVTFKRNFGPEGNVEYILWGDVGPAHVKVFQDMAEASRRVVELFGPKGWYSGLLIGTVGIPVVPYLMGIFVGNVGQVQVGQGVRAALADGVGFAPMAAMATLKDAADAEVSFVAGVMARTFGDGTNRPNTVPIITEDGRIITADYVETNIDRFGLKQSFADTLKNNSVHDAILDRFSKANPRMLGAAIGGTLGTLLGGLPGGAAGAALGGASLRGVSLGSLFKRGSRFTKNHRFYAETATAIDTYFRIKVLVRELKRGATMEAAAAKARSVVLDYSDLSKVERHLIRQFFAFYIYFKQAGKLFLKTAIENPSRLTTQLKLARSTQLAVTGGEDPEKRFASWDKPRTYIPVNVGGNAIRIHMLNVADIVAIVSDFYSIVQFSGEDSVNAAMRMVGRANPMFVETFKQIYKVDPGMGYSLDRATNQVPALLVQLDHDIFGGTMYEALGLEYIKPDKIKLTYDDKTNRRINLRNLEMPNRGVYISNKPLRSSLVLDYFQSPLSGRMLDIIEAVDRSNIGITEAMVWAADKYYQADKERPLLARIPGLVPMGLVKGKREKTIDIGGREVEFIRPTGTDGRMDTSTGRRKMREHYSFVGTDGGKYLLRYDDFYPLELLKVIGLSATPIRDPDIQDARKVKEHTAELKKNTKQ